MTKSSHTSPAHPTSHQEKPPKQQLAFLQWLISVLLVVGALCWLQFAPHKSVDPSATAPIATLSVEAVGPHQIAVDLNAPIGKKISLQVVESHTITDPLLQVSGGLLGCRRPGKSGNADFWQFSTAELLTTYTEYEKATADLDFATSQFARIQELTRTKEESLAREVARSEKLVQSGTEAARDLAMLKTTLLETKIENEKTIYEAESAIKGARRKLLALGIQLQQTGLDPELLKNATPDIDIIAAEVPEAKVGLVSLGQGCTARFFGLPNTSFQGKVASLSPILSTERRTLRVLFVLKDPHDELRPGMFADIGIGVDPHQVVRVPAESVIHIDRSDYVLTVDGASPSASDPHESKDSAGRLLLNGRKVVVSEMVEGQVNVLSGLEAGEKIAIGAVILLKPALAAAMQMQPATDVSATQKDAR